MRDDGGALSGLFLVRRWYPFSGVAPMISRHPRSNPFSLSAEVLEVRSLLSAGAPAVAAHPGVHSHAAAQTGVVGQLATNTPVTVSTIPANGDLNPYGVAFVPQGFVHGGMLNPGDLLVSNFNDSSNLQGTGTTIIRVTPGGQVSTFFPGQPGLGLTTALGVLKNGFVIVGSMPTKSMGMNPQPGELLILDKNGHVVETLTDPKLIDGPWDLTINEHGPFAQVFVSNVLSGTVTRIDLRVPRGASKPIVLDEVQIASGFTTQPNASALVLGPTGLAFDAKTNTLFVASTADNEIFAIPNAGSRSTDAGTGKVVVNDQTHLHGPLGLVLAPNGDLIVANGDAVNTDPNQPSEIVEFTQSGQFVSQFSLDPSVDGPFGIAIASENGRIRFAAVDDNDNMVSIWTLPEHQHHLPPF
jgi:hypothetical protein